MNFTVLISLLIVVVVVVAVEAEGQDATTSKMEDDAHKAAVATIVSQLTPDQVLQF